MSTEDLQHSFEKTRHKVAKHIIKKPRMDLMDLNLFVALPLMSIAVIPQLFVEEFNDYQTTDATVQVEQQLQQRLSGMSVVTEQATTQKLIADVLMAEDLSEDQAEDLLEQLEDKTGDIDTIAGYKIGNIGDLRECRADNDTAKAIASCTVEQEKDDNVVVAIDATLTIFALLLLIGRGVGHGLRSNLTVQRWGKKEPRHLRFKH